MNAEQSTMIVHVAGGTQSAPATGGGPSAAATTEQGEGVRGRGGEGRGREEGDGCRDGGGGEASGGRGAQEEWLHMGKQAAESRCFVLEGELRSIKAELAKRDTSIKVAHEKIRHLEAESSGLLAAAEFRENEACSMQERASLAQERALAHEKALASALEQRLSDSGVSQSKKLAELAGATQELKRTKAALERAERLVFDQRREADERQCDEDRRRAETEALRDKLTRVERKNTELMAKQAAGRLAKRMRGNFGRSSTFCASFCSCFRGKPAYRRVASPAPFAPPPGSSPGESPWLGEETVGSLSGGGGRGL
ncbi:unnamed protein product [Ectocarpus fasciculatus]